MAARKPKDKEVQAQAEARGRRDGYRTPRDEYVGSPVAIGLRGLAAKWGVPFPTIAKQANSEDWVGQRDKYQREVAALTDSRAAILISESLAEARARHIARYTAIEAMLCESLAHDTRSLQSKDTTLKFLLEVMRDKDKMLGIRGIEDAGEGKEDVAIADMLDAFEARRKREEAGLPEEDEAEKEEAGEEAEDMPWNVGEDSPE